MGDLSNPGFNHQLRLIQHSVATPVTNLLLNLERLRDQPRSKKSNFQFHLNQAWLSANYLQQLIKHFSQPEKKIKFRVRQAVVEVSQLIKKPSDHRQLIELIKIGPELKLNGNKFSFQECLICLLNNAFEAYKEDCSTKTVMLVVENLGSELLVKVVDGAGGIEAVTGQLLLLKEAAPAKINQLAFQPLPSTKSEHLGFGLKFIKKVVCLDFKGKLEIKTSPGKGTQINCYFPLLDQQ
ncbi:MAG: hypothetical protein GF381_03950 [Candidatus Pacebacteria bacterium]|nr:hypothetical protein [Candidatus Paceibacterota bacterium]